MVSHDNRVFETLNTITTIALIGMITFVGCLPIITVVWSLAAGYYTMVKVVREDRGSALSEFVGYIKKYWKTCAPVSLLVFVIGVILVLNIRFMYCTQTSNTIFGILLMTYGFMLLALVCTASHLLLVLARFNLNSWKSAQMAIILAFKHPLRTLFIMIELIVFAVVVYFYPLALVLLLGGVIYILVIIEEPLVLKYTDKQDV